MSWEDIRQWLRFMQLVYSAMKAFNSTDFEACCWVVEDTAFDLSGRFLG